MYQKNHPHQNVTRFGHLKPRKTLLFVWFFIVLVSFPICVFSSASANSETDSEIGFSHERGLYLNAFALSLSAKEGAQIYFTKNGRNPASRNGIPYYEALQINTTTVLKAVAITDSDTSEVYTHTYIFPELVAQQGKSPMGFPQVWGGAKVISADYEMDPEIINNILYKSGITEAFYSLPSLSLSMPVNEWFDPEYGLYRGYEDTDEITEKAVTAEFIFTEGQEQSFGIECGIQNQGGTSIVKWKSPKQSMRLLFKEMYGPKRLDYKVFHDSDIRSINTLVVDNMLNATWIHPTDDKQRVHAMYLRDQLTCDLHKEMGHLAVHGRYFNLYLNGLYWGICNLHERPDDAFMSEYEDANREDYDIIKHNPDEIVAGSNFSYVNMLNTVRAGVSTNEQLNEIGEHLNLPAFIDYMILNFYLGNFDWAHQNWYAAKNHNLGTGYRYFCWDSEHVMRFLELDFNNTYKNNQNGPTEIHTLLKANEEYRMMFADAVYKHLFNNGALTPDNFLKTFEKRKNEIEKAIVLESARWGDYRKDVSNVTYTKNRHWNVEVYKAMHDYIPYRRDVVIEQFRTSKNKLFPDIMPPIIYEYPIGENAKSVRFEKAGNELGTIYYTMDGTDPRKTGGEIQGQAYTGEVRLEESTTLKARFYSTIDKTWSALTERTVVLDKVYGEKMVINEIMYHPLDGYPEYISLLNAGSSNVNLKGFAFTDGIDFTFLSDVEVAPGTNVILSNDSVLYKSVYEIAPAGQYNKKLSNKGEILLLQNGFHQLVDSVCYTDSLPWPSLADGTGYSLVLKDPNLDNSIAENWEVSGFVNNSPELGLEDFFEASIYPNPFQSKVKIDFQYSGSPIEEGIIHVYSSMGQKIKTTRVNDFSNSLEIDLKEAKPGLYFIKIEVKGSTEKSRTLKAIKL